MAKTLAHTIGTLDNLVFPNAGITKIAITPEAPRSGESHYGYAPPGANDDGSGDYYQIFGVGIDKAIKDEVSTEHIVLIKDKLTKHCSFGDYPPITLDELRIQMVPCDELILQEVANCNYLVHA